MEPGSSSTESAMLSRIALNDNKAGMEGLDKEKINKIILEVSKGSRFYENKLKKEHQVNQRIEKMMRHKSKLTEQQIQQAQAEVDKMTSELERRRELGRVIVHVDMDAFYAAVEMKDCPELKEKPMAVGSMSMLSTSNYHARRYGVRAAMPGFIAKKLCPNLVIVPPNFNKYRAVSEQVREIFADYDPQFLPMSLDEAYLDITEHLEQRQHWPESRRTYRICEDKREGEMDIVKNGDREDTSSPVLFDDSPSALPSVPGTDGKVELFGTSPEEAVREMRFRIEQKTSLTASAGIAPNTMLAKVCSDKNKPNGQYRIPPDTQTVMNFIQDLPVRKVSGIGKVTEKMLAALGIVTCSQLREQMGMLSLLFSETSWHHFLQISLGLGSTHLERDSERKSMSTERTFAEMSDAEEQYSLCRELCHDLAEDLRKEGIKGKTVTLKLKNVSFEVKTRAFTLQYAVCTEEEIFAAAKELLRVEIDHVSPHPLRLRLMGVRVSSFISTDDKNPQQKSIMRFLKTTSDLKSSTQLSAFKPEPDCSISSKKQPCAEMRSSLRSEETPRPVHKNVTGSEGTTASPQQTFFQKAYAKRLQKQSEQEQTLSIINGHQTDKTSKRLPADSEITGFTATNNETPVKTKTCSSERSVDPDETVDKAGTHSNIRASPRVKSRSLKKASSSNTLQCFTCPVCFTEIETTDLTVFNCHIDECLCSGVADVGTSVDVGQDVYEDEKRSDRQSEAEKDRPISNHCSAADSSSVENVNEVLHSSSVSLTPKNLSENKARFDSRIPFFKRIASMKEKPDKITSDPAAFQQAGSSDGVITQPMDAKVSILTCPVCNQAQDTDDLTRFNHHVDMCLNQEVLLELRETNPQRARSDAASPEKVKGHEKVSNARGKSKRRGSSPPPPSKKAKAVGTKHTIDKFFVGTQSNCASLCCGLQKHRSC